MGFPIVVADGGATVIIYTAEGGGDYPIHGAYYSGDAESGWIPVAWQANGCLLRNGKHSGLNLTKALNAGKIPVPSKEVQGQVQVETGRAILPNDPAEGPASTV